MDLLEKGTLRLRWAEAHMPVLVAVRERFGKEKPLKGLKVGMALHTEAKTGILAITLAEAGAEVRLYGLDVRAKKGETNEEYYANLNHVLDMGPDYVIDDGSDLIAMLHTSRREMLPNVKGANEETTTGVIRLRAMAADGALQFPVMAVNDSKMKFLFDNRYGTGQSAFDGWMTATNLMVSGKTLVVAGYGWCGKGVAMRAKGLGADVIVTEVDPIRAIEARMDGFRVMRMEDAAKEAEIIITVTGCKSIVRKEHLEVMRDGCVMGNVGHFDNEISKPDLEALSTEVTRVRDFVDEYRLKDGRRVYLISDGRLMNLAAGQGHPAEIMDMSFAVQALGLEYLVKNHQSLEAGVHTVPDSIDVRIAELKLQAMGITIDQLTQEQRDYITGWEEGT